MSGTPSAADDERVATIERLLEAPMPWIGMYVAAASLVCTAAMAIDTLHGLWNKKLWFPSNCFSLNATSLTLLAVATKLPVDLTTRMYTATDRLAKISSLAFMSAAMANFLTSLGSMRDKDILSNVAALAILVITIVANVFVQVAEMRSYLTTRRAFHEEILVIAAMLLQLIMFVSLAVMIQSTKLYMERKYQEMHRSALDEDEADLGRFTVDKLRVLIKKHWVMAETSNPQFVIARSVVCTTSGVLSIMTALVLLEGEIRMETEFNILNDESSSYMWSTKFVMLIQTAGVIVGTIAPAARWLISIKYRSLNQVIRNEGSGHCVERYWIQKMVEWRQRSLSHQIPYLKSRKAVHALRGLFLNFCINAQCLIVLTSRLVLVVSLCLTSPITWCLRHLRRLKRQNRVSQSVSSHNPSANPELDIGRYVMLLEGEVELPAETLESICKEVDELMQKGKMRKPHNLLKLLSKSCSFQGVTEFDSDQVPSLYSQELPYCWSLPVVTLACIALALPNIEKSQCSILLSSVTEGLSLMKLVDKALDKKRGLVNIRNAADAVWVKVELYHMWQDTNLHEASLKGKNSAEILQELRDKAEKCVMEFQRGFRNCIMRNPVNWPAKVIAANSMYRVSSTILASHGSGESDEALFEKLWIMIADIVAACLTNLAQVIALKVHRKAIEKRERRVRKAALILGQTEEIIGLLQQRQLPISNPNKVADIQQWRAAVKQEAADDDVDPE